MFVIPRPGVLVRDHISRALLPAEGRDVPNDAFWQRRLRDGDVTLGSPGDVRLDVPPGPVISVIPPASGASRKEPA